MLKKNHLLFILVFILANITTHALNYYVSATGNDNNNGLTITTPFRTMQKALNVSTAGTTIYVRGGTYKQKLVWTNSGAASMPITLTNYNNELVYLDGGTGVTNATQSGMIEIGSKSFININGILINNYYKNGAIGIFITGAGTDIRITNCKIYNMGWKASKTAIPTSSQNANGILVIGTTANAYNNIYIGYNELYNCITGYSEVLSLNGNINNFLLERNIVHDNTNIGIDMAGFYIWTGAPAVSNQVRNGNVINNTVYRCISKVATSAGIYVDGGKWINIQGNNCYENGYGIEVGCENSNAIVEGVNVRNNFVYNNVEAGIGIGAVGANSLVQNSSVTGNTLYKNFSNNGYGGDIVLQKTNAVTLRSNIVYSRSAVVLVAGAGYPSTNLNIDYNLYFTPTNTISFDWGGINGLGYYSLTSFQTATGFDIHANYSNPLFVSGTLPSPNLHIGSATSKAVNSGDTAYVLKPGEVDIDGENRIQSGRLDVGADETIFTNLPSSFVSAKSMMNADAENILQKQVSIYPNPVSGNLTIAMPNSKVEKLVTIFDAKGQILFIKKMTGDLLKIDMAALHLETKFLLVKIVSENENITKKIIVQ